MKLDELLKYDEITIQCHDNPDPDAVASGFALYTYFTENNKKTKFVYSGNNRIRKSNLLLMIASAQIPLTYVPPQNQKFNGLLITVDCCYGEGNVTAFAADEIAIIDHHRCASVRPNSEIYPGIGSCSTVVWKMLRECGFDFSNHDLMNTMLYYGLMTDTGNFIEMHHPLDRDMMDFLEYDNGLLNQLCNSNISLEDMVIAGKAMTDYSYQEMDKSGIFRAEACDPNLLGLISDLVLQVDTISVCLVYCELAEGFKLSVRSCSKEVHANELIKYIVDKIGNGGGHTDKAGGYISKTMFSDNYPNLSIQEYLSKILRQYFSVCRCIDVKNYTLDTTGMELYEKRPLKRGYVVPTEFLPIGEKVMVRTLEGDVDLVIDGSFYIMIGLKGEVYPIKKEEFELQYNVLEEPYEMQLEYVPQLHSNSDGCIYALSGYAHSCMSNGGAKILAKPLDYILKLFTLWDRDNYYLGNPGDYLACRQDNTKDIYIIAKDIFGQTYQKCDL